MGQIRPVVTENTLDLILKFIWQGPHPRRHFGVGSHGIKSEVMRDPVPAVRESELSIFSECQIVSLIGQTCVLHLKGEKISFRVEPQIERMEDRALGDVPVFEKLCGFIFFSVNLIDNDLRRPPRELRSAPVRLGKMLLAPKPTISLLRV